jgi:hypothetical protein
MRRKTCEDSRGLDSDFESNLVRHPQRRVMLLLRKLTSSHLLPANSEWSDAAMHEVHK